MIIIDYFGFSGSGKSFSAKEISTKLKLDMDFEFLKINKYHVFKRVLFKIYFISFIKISDLKKVNDIQKCFIFEKKITRLKNLFSFLYLIGFIKYKSKFSKILILDHGLMQCLLSCFLFSKNKNYNYDIILKKFNTILNFLNKYYSFYCLILMEHDWDLISKRLKERDGKKIKYLINKSNIQLYNNALENCNFIYKNLANNNFKLFFNQSFQNDNYVELKILLQKNEK